MWRFRMVTLGLIACVTELREAQRGFDYGR
jgi:hypothetical protein